jgi:hypothetical protein
MVAPVTRNVREPTAKVRQDAYGRPAVCEWRLVDHFNTVEDAEVTVERLRLAGVEAELSLIDGLCVIARRTDRARDPATP